MKQTFAQRGFTLIEVMVVVTIMMILSGIVLAAMANASKSGRDAKRQSDVVNLKTAIEQYRLRYGRYPDAGCGTQPFNWVSERECTDYITGSSTLGSTFAPTFINQLPRDPSRNGNQGYSYMVNDEGTVFKLMAMNTVEGEMVDYKHPLKSCYIIPDYAGNYPTTGIGSTNLINVGGMCGFYDWQFLPNVDDWWSGSKRTQPSWCKRSGDDGGDSGGSNGGSRFDRSYGVWGGFSRLDTNISATSKPKDIGNTTAVICR